MQAAVIMPRTYGTTGLMKAERGTRNPPRPIGTKGNNDGTQGSLGGHASQPTARRETEFQAAGRLWLTE
jgi:hypothetical protein